MLSNQILSIRQKCWMPPKFSASSLMNITVLDFQSGPNTSCSEFRLPMTQLYIVFQSNVNFSLDSCIGYHKMWSNQISSIRQKCWMPPNFSASSLINITILDFQSGPNTNCSEFRLPMTQLYKFFQSNVSISLDLCIGHHKMWSNQSLINEYYKCEFSFCRSYGYNLIWLVKHRIKLVDLNCFTIRALYFLNYEWL